MTDDYQLDFDSLIEPAEEDDPGYEPAEQVEYEQQAEKARADIGGEPLDAAAPEWVRQKFPSVDWAAAFEIDFSKVEWLLGRFIERGQQVSLIGDGKVGKSLFVLEWVWRLVAGMSFMGDAKHEPIRVIYFDRENSLRDVITRCKAFGASVSNLADLVYKQFPQFDGSLDMCEAAANQLVNLAIGYRAQLVILDTVSRFIGGKENDADTWLQLYRMVHAKLKAKGIACVRLDHFGKDDTRGSRGSSAKSQDVDHVWELKQTGNTVESAAAEDGTFLDTVITQLTLTRTHTRSGLGEDEFHLERRGTKVRTGGWVAGRTSHRMSTVGSDVPISRTISDEVDELIDRGVPTGVGREALRGWMVANGVKPGRNEHLSAICKELKLRDRIADEGPK